MKFTGERFIPTEQGRIRLEHYHRYATILDIVSGKEVLDVACGEGYGSAMMSEVARNVAGVDISDEAVQHATHKYSNRKNLSFSQGSATALQFAEASFDVVVSFETIEHLAEQAQMISEIRRVLRKDGILIISSPNRPVYSEESGEHNEFHVKELDFNEFDELLKSHFPFIQFYGQRMLIGSVIQSLEGKQSAYTAWHDDGESIKPKTGKLTDPVYFVAVCGGKNSILPLLDSSIVYPDKLDLMKHYIGFAKWAQNLDKVVAERDSHIKNLNSDVAVRDSQIENLNSDVAVRDSQIRSLSQALAVRDSSFFNCVRPFFRSKIAGTFVGDWVRFYRDIKRRRINMVSLESIKNSLLASDGRLIITFPIITWEFRWQRPQHIVSHLCDHGFAVLYLAMTLTPLHRRFKSFADASARVSFSKLAPKVQQAWLHSAKKLNVYADSIEGDDLFNLAISLEAIINELKPKSIHYLIHFPGWWPVVESLKKRLGGTVIFDCMDDHAGFSTNSSRVLKLEHDLVAKADLVITSSSVLADRCQQLNPHTIQVKNGTEFEHFAKPIKNGLLDQLADRTVIGYYGAISDWFDMEIVAYCAHQRPDWNFVLIGATFGGDIEQVKDLTNVHLLGEKAYKDLPGYLAYFDVCIIPFKIIPLTMATNPVKFYEYLSSGKPVVSVNLPELVPHQDNCYLAKDKIEFLEKVQTALNDKNNTELIERRIDFARENSWDSRVNSIIPHLESNTLDK